MLELQSKTLQYFVATIPPTIASLTLTNPLWVVKSVQAASLNIDGHHPTFSRCMKQVYRKHGLYGFQKGLLFGYLNSVNGIITFTLYDVFKDYFNVNTSVGYASCSSISKTLAYFISYPLLVIRTRQQIQQINIKIAFAEIYREPFRHLYFGLTPTLVQMVPKTALLLVLYENVLKLLK